MGGSESESAVGLELGSESSAVERSALTCDARLVSSGRLTTEALVGGDGSDRKADVGVNGWFIAPGQIARIEGGRLRRSVVDVGDGDEDAQLDGESGGRGNDSGKESADGGEEGYLGEIRANF